VVSVEDNIAIHMWQLERLNKQGLFLFLYKKIYIAKGGYLFYYLGERRYDLAAEGVSRVHGPALIHYENQ
jgi:hypothetical protein